MEETTNNNNKDLIKKLENFICNNPELDDLENYCAEFNIFDCIGMGNQEIKHSNFLAWLFNPKENHGLGDFFIKEFLKEVIRNSEISYLSYNVPSVFDIDSWDMTETIVERECDHIDIIFKDKINKFICVIENKIYAKQTGKQCENYYNKIFQEKRNKNNEYSGYEKHLFIYLKPIEEDTPNEYVYVSYAQIEKIINKMLNRKQDYLNEKILLVIKSYKELIRRKFMSENDEITEICQKIYSNHKRAINTIIEKLDLVSDSCQEEIAKFLIEYIKEIKDDADKSKYIFLRHSDTATRNICFIPSDIFDYKDIFEFNLNNTGAVLKIYATYKNNTLDKEYISRKCCDSKYTNTLGTILTTKDYDSIRSAFIENSGILKDNDKSKISKTLVEILNNINIDLLKKYFGEFKKENNLQ